MQIWWVIIITNLLMLYIALDLIITQIYKFSLKIEIESFVIPTLSLNKSAEHITYLMNNKIKLNNNLIK